MIHRGWLLILLTIVVVLITLMIVGELSLYYGLTWIILMFTTLAMNITHSDDKDDIFCTSLFAIGSVVAITVGLYYVSSDTVMKHIVFFIGNIVSVLVSWFVTMKLVPDYSLPKDKQDGGEIAPRLDIFD